MSYITSLLRSLISFLKTARGRVVGAAVLLLIVLIVVKISDDGSRVQTVTVVRGAVADISSVTGSVQPVQSVDLAFAAGGRIASTPVRVGDEVVIGQTLASLDNFELSARLHDAQANVLAQRIRLDELQRGTRADEIAEIAIKEAEFNKAQQDLENAYDDTQDVLIAAYADATDAVRVQIASLFNSTGTAPEPRYELTFQCAGVCDQDISLAESLRAQSEVALLWWLDELNDISSLTSEQELVDSLANAREYLQTAKRMLDFVDAVLNNPGVQLSSTTLATYRTSVSTAQMSISTALTSVTTQHQAILSAQLTADRIANELALKRAGSTPEEIATQEAILLSAQAQAQRIRALMAKNIIRSPISGIVTRQDAKVGQTAVINEPLISVMSGQELEIEANVPEVDIGPLMIGDRVAITVDALPDEQFSGSLVSIEPAETIVGGVVNFKVKVMFDVSDERLKSGMTVNLDIESRKVEDALVIPVYAVFSENGSTYVKVLHGRAIEEVDITTGARSRDGMIQVISGLVEGDEVVIGGNGTSE
jgi:HlyD family secretion protein